jgi:hypothetical protein
MRIALAKVNRRKLHRLQIQLVLASRPAEQKAGEIQPFQKRMLTTCDGDGHGDLLHIRSRVFGKADAILVAAAAREKTLESILSVSPTETAAICIHVDLDAYGDSESSVRSQYGTGPNLD